MLQISNISLNRGTIIGLFASSLRRWLPQHKIDLVVVECTEGGHAYGRATIVYAGKNVQVYFRHQAIVDGICQASAAAGTALEKSSLTFKFIAGNRFGNVTPSIAASASPAASGALNQGAENPSLVACIESISLMFDRTELLELLRAAVKRAGTEPIVADIWQAGNRAGQGHITTRTGSGAIGTISLPPNELNELLIKELTVRGYMVKADSLQYMGGGSGSSCITYLSVNLTAIPK